MLTAMALVDYIPVIIFLFSAILLQRCLYRAMSKGAFALLCAGTIMVILAGTFKATWKLLYNTGVCDFEALNKCFFPMQASGFLLAGISMIAMLAAPQHRKVMSVAAVPAFSGTMIFVVMMVLGVAGINIGLSIVSVKMKRGKIMILFILSLIFMLGMGYLSSKDFSIPAMNWIGEGVNILGQITLLLGIMDLKKHGLEAKESF